MKTDIKKVHPGMAKQALINAKLDRNGAYSQYILLMYKSTGSLNARCNAKDLQAWYDQEEEKNIGIEYRHGVY